MASATQPTTELPSAQEWKDLLEQILPPQGEWSEEEYLVLTDHRNRLVEFTDGFLEVLPMPTDKHQSVLQFLFLAFFRGRKAKADRSDRKRDRSDIVKLDGPADVRAIFTRARHFDFGPPFAGDPWDDRPTLGPNVARFPSAIPAGQKGGLVARSGEALLVPARGRFD